MNTGDIGGDAGQRVGPLDDLERQALRRRYRVRNRLLALAVFVSSAVIGFYVMGPAWNTAPYEFTDEEKLREAVGMPLFTIGLYGILAVAIAPSWSWIGFKAGAVAISKFFGFLLISALVLGVLGWFVYGAYHALTTMSLTTFLLLMIIWLLVTQRK